MHIFPKEQFLRISYKDKEGILGLQGKRLGKANKKQTERGRLAERDGGDSSGAISRPAGTKVVFSLCLEGGAEYLSLFVNLCSSFGSTEGRQRVLPSAAPQLSSTEQTFMCGGIHSGVGSLPTLEKAAGDPSPWPAFLHSTHHTSPCLLFGLFPQKHTTPGQGEILFSASSNGQQCLAHTRCSAGITIVIPQ